MLIWVSIGENFVREMFGKTLEALSMGDNVCNALTTIYNTLQYIVYCEIYKKYLFPFILRESIPFSA